MHSMRHSGKREAIVRNPGTLANWQSGCFADSVPLPTRFRIVPAECPEWRDSVWLGVHIHKHHYIRQYKRYHEGVDFPILVQRVHISLVVAMDANGLIGAGGGLPWRLPADLKHFRRKTVGKPILMGRRTFESIGRPLPGRENLVLTRDSGFDAGGTHRVASLDEALNWAHEGGFAELAVIGGAQVYALALPRVERLYLTRVHSAFDGDTHFPAIDWREWCEVEREDRAADDRHAHDFSFIELRRVG